MFRGDRVAVLLVLLAGMLAAAAGNASAAGWLPATNASPVLSNASKFSGSLQDVAVDAQGNATAVWVQWVGFGDMEILEAATRPAGGAWSASVQLSQAGEQPLSPKVVVSPDGEATVVWLGYNGSTEVVRAATRPAGGAWSQPVALSDLDEYASGPDLAIDPQGNATAIWTGGPQFEHRFVQTATRPAGGSWSQPVALSDESEAAVWPHITSDAQGDLTAIWDLGGEEGVIQSKTRPAGGEWSSAAVDVSDEDGLSSYPRMAIDGQGDAVAVWQQKDIHAASGFHYFVQTARRTGGSWSTPLTISREDGLAMNPLLALDPQGNATVVWDWAPLATGTAHGLQARSATAGGSWGATVYVVTSPGGLEPSESGVQLLADPQGNVTIIWEGWSAPNDVVRSARRTAGGTWSSPVTLSTGESFIPAAAIDPQGAITAVWSGRQGTTQAVRSRVFDPIPPELNDLEVPATGVVGQPVAMSVDPFDLWSPVTSSWKFGDGGSGSGATVSHCYSSPGERTVTVTGTDLAANATSASQAITIDPDPTLGPGSHPCAAPEPPDNPDPPDNPGSPGSPGTTDNGGPPEPPGHNDPGSAAPVLSGLRQSSSRWRTRAVDRQPRLPIGTTFRFKLNRPAQTQFAFSRVASGRREGGRCVEAIKANRKKPRCNRFRALGTLEIDGGAGANGYGFSGKIGERMLEPGRYRLLVTARADGKTSTPASIGFTIVR
jgi:PKD domain